MIVKLTLHTLLLALALMSLSYGNTSIISQNSVASVSEGKPISIGQSFTLKSIALDDDREINISLPFSYNSAPNGETSYSVLYVIDGGLQQDFLHISGLGSLASVSPYIFQELIVVGISTNNRLFETTALNNDPRYDKPKGHLGGSDKFRDHIQQEVVPFIEKNYRTNNRRAVIGESLAGLFIVETFLKTPNLFTDYISISPSLWYDDRALSKNAIARLKSNDFTNRKLYLSMANEGGTMQTGLDELISAIQQVKPRGLDWKYVGRQDSEFHWTIYHGAALDALRWLFPKSLPEYDDTPAWYLVEGANPPD